MPKLTKKSFRAFLDTLEKDELIAEIEKLYAKIKHVQEYYQMDFGDSESVLEEYKKQIDKEFKSKNREPRATTLRKITTEFKNIAVHQSDVVLLLLYRVEKALLFLNDSFREGYSRSAGFSDAILTAFEEAMKLIKQERLEAQFRPACEKIVRESGDYMEYAMASTYTKYYLDGALNDIINKPRWFIL